jgi:hypothetical protein
MATHETPSLGGASLEAEFALIQTLDTAALYLGLAEAALRKAPEVERTTEGNLTSTEVLGFLNECSIKDSAIHHRLRDLGARLREHHLGRIE